MIVSSSEQIAPKCAHDHGFSTLLDREPRAVQVGLGRLADHGQVGVDRPLPGVVRDGGVVDQDVQPAVPLTHLPRRGGDAGRVGDVEGKGFGVDGAGGGRRRIGRTGGEQHNVAQLGELAAHLPADAAVAAGDRRYGAHFWAHMVDCLQIM